MAAACACDHGCCGLIYVSVQQNYRQSLNDPQIQMPEDVARQLGDGADVEEIEAFKGWPIAIDRSLSPWVAVLNPDGTIYSKEGVAQGVTAYFEATSGLFGVDGGPIIAHATERIFPFRRVCSITREQILVRMPTVPTKIGLRGNLHLTCAKLSSLSH